MSGLYTYEVRKKKLTLSRSPEWASEWEPFPKCTRYHDFFFDFRATTSLHTCIFWHILAIVYKTRHTSIIQLEGLSKMVTKSKQVSTRLHMYWLYLYSPCIGGKIPKSETLAKDWAIITFRGRYFQSRKFRRCFAFWNFASLRLYGQKLPRIRWTLAS